MSAATMMACACDVIVMGKQSAIGPTDPQITFPVQTGYYSAPARSILDEYEEAKREVTKNPRLAALWISKIDKYPHGFLKQC